MSLLQKCCKCKCEQELKYYSNNKKGVLYKTCEKCRLKRTQPSSDTDIISGAIKLLTEATHKLEHVIKDDVIEDKPVIDENKINVFAKLIAYLDITRPCGDDIMDDPVKANELMNIGSKRITLLRQIDKLDIATQKKIGERYNELIEEYNKPFDDSIKYESRDGNYGCVEYRSNGDMVGFRD